MTATGTGVEVRLLERADEFGQVDALLVDIWAGPSAVVPVELLTAFVHAGGYVAGAFRGGAMVGASVGFLARHRDRSALHSHVTGVAAAGRDAGVGRALKLHQRDWAAECGIEWITWTFDPLVRRNAWFNLAVLGVEVHGYLPSFYGAMDDAINAGDESDRLLVAWAVREDDRLVPVTDARGRDGVTTIPTPADVVELRRTDPAAVSRWRRETRDAFTEALGNGRPVLGFTRDGHYLMGSPP